MMKEKIKNRLKEIMAELGAEISVLTLDYPENPDFGDFSTNVALINSKRLNIPAKVLAERIVLEFNKNLPEYLEKVTVAGPGFINFFVKDKIIAKEILEIVSGDQKYGTSKNEEGKKIIVEFTDPNAFKVFHIGHLMSNAIGESISRLIESCGVSVKRICYSADIGLHIAKSIWSIQKHKDEIPDESASIQAKTEFLGKMYVLGTNTYENDPTVKAEIDALNKVLYEKTDLEVDKLYEKGRKWSLDHFEILYKILGTKFDDYIYESEMAGIGLETVNQFLEKGIFEKSDGAIVFKGENYGLHTRVFVNAHGLPTYEAKDLGLNITKFKKYPDTDQSIIITASEQNDYFKVLLKVISLIDGENGLKTKHIGHGMMRFLTGKMSSRTGNVITAESLLEDIKDMVKNKIESRNFTESEADEISNDVAVAAIKYTILRSSIGSDIIFDSAASISFEGDSGPYLQYSAVRAGSILEKAKEEGINTFESGKISVGDVVLPEKITILEKMITRFPDVVSRARNEFAPQIVSNYLVGLAGAFNSFYASQVIVDKNNKLSPYYIALSRVFLLTMTNGLWILGIKVPKKM